MKDKIEIKKPEGKLGVLIPGLGAVATTFIAGTMLVRKGLGRPFGSLTQMGTIRLGKRTEKRVPKIKDFVELADLNDLVFAAWDIFPDNAYESALKAGVLKKEDLEPVRAELEKSSRCRLSLTAIILKTWMVPIKRAGPISMI